MAVKKSFAESDLAQLAKEFRIAAGKKRADAAREMGVKQVSIFHAEESPGKSYFKLRKKMIEHYSAYIVTGPIFSLKKK